jgi:hypothetical protein
MIDDELRALLQRKAGEVPPQGKVPKSLVVRARRRIALNAVATGMTAAVLVVGALVGVRALGRGPDVVPPVETPPPSSITACTAGQLRAVGSMEGAAGSREGAIRLTNLSSARCTLQGTPALQLLDQNLRPITSGVRFGTSPAGWVADAKQAPAGWPIVTLAPGDAAAVRVRWSNWCPDGRAAPLWRVTIPGSGTVDVFGFDAVAPPPCNGPGLPSTIERGPFEPTTGR